jgi:DNA-binding ferritin-like protein
MNQNKKTTGMMNYISDIFIPPTVNQVQPPKNKNNNKNKNKNNNMTPIVLQMNTPNNPPIITPPSNIKPNNSKEKLRGDLLQFFFNLMIQIKSHHWATTSYSRHKATDKILEELQSTIDMFVETYQGIYGRLRCVDNVNDILYIRYKTEDEMDQFLQQSIFFLQTTIIQYFDPTKDTDLMNLRDELLALLHKLQYLFTLNGKRSNNNKK